MVPQVEPATLLLPSMQREAPVLQSVTPFRHTSGLVLQVLPDIQETQTPTALQTCPAPQLVPAVALTSSRHRVEPVLQSVRPSLQGAPGLVVQTTLGTQAPQLPFASQVWLVPQLVPAILLLPSTQREAPVLHSVMPFLHGEGLVAQVMFATHATQEPVAEQTWLRPHGVPAERLLASTQVCTPDAHDVVPNLQPGEGFVVQVTLAMQLAQLPVAVQTWSGPQDVPGERGIESTQRVLPLLQSMTPERQGAPGLLVQGVPATQAPQNPFPSHTCPVPHIVPASRTSPSTQLCEPVAHEVVPTRQGAEGFPGHGPPALQAAQAPVAVHTCPEPHGVPAARRASSTQTGAPVEHSVTPRRHGFGLPEHGVPGEQRAQPPAPSQTWFVPQAVPAGAFAPSMHPGVAPHVVRPRLHGLPGLAEQATSGTQAWHEP